MKGTLSLKTGVAVAAMLLAGTALAQEYGGGGGGGFGNHRPPMERAMGGQGEHGRWWNNPKVVDRLKLTDDQRKSMDAILLAHREKLVDLRASLEKSELELEPLMKEDQPNENAILAQIDKTASARAELEKANARFLLAIRGKLTADQWRQMQADRADRSRGDWNRDRQGQRGMHRGGQTAAPAGGQSGPPAGGPPAGPQGMLEGSAGVDGPPPPAEGAFR
jgi:Spy/CpxP family protein refolding chaperone